MSVESNVMVLTTFVFCESSIPLIAEKTKVVKTITFDSTDIHAYYKLNLSEMLEPQYANVRPKALEITINNYNADLTENIDTWYLHTPLRDDDLDVQKLSHFSNHIQFNKKTTIKNPQPYLTYCQTNDEGDIVDIDISQSTNVNLLPDRAPFMSLGALIFQLNQINCQFESDFTGSNTI